MKNSNNTSKDVQWLTECRQLRPRASRQTSSRHPWQPCWRPIGPRGFPSHFQNCWLKKSKSLRAASFVDWQSHDELPRLRPDCWSYCCWHCWPPCGPGFRNGVDRSDLFWVARPHRRALRWARILVRILDPLVPHRYYGVRHVLAPLRGHLRFGCDLECNIETTTIKSSRKYFTDFLTFQSLTLTNIS